MPVRGSRLTTALLVGVVVVVILGVGVALAVSGAQRKDAASASAGRATPDQAAASAPGATGALATSARATSAPATSAPTTAAATPASAAVRSTSSSDGQPVAGPSTNLTVQLSPAARTHPRAEQVQQLLQSYFDAINRHDYAAWSAVVTSSQTQRENSEHWLAAYATTVDSSIWVRSLSGSPLRADLRFTSEQDPDLAPPDLAVDCIDWALTYQLNEQDGQLVVGSTVPGSVARTRCP